MSSSARLQALTVEFFMTAAAVAKEPRSQGVEEPGPEELLYKLLLTPAAAPVLHPLDSVLGAAKASSFL